MMGPTGIQWRPQIQPTAAPPHVPNLYTRDESSALTDLIAVNWLKQQGFQYHNDIEYRYYFKPGDDIAHLNFIFSCSPNKVSALLSYDGDYFFAHFNKDESIADWLSKNNFVYEEGNIYVRKLVQGADSEEFFRRNKPVGVTIVSCDDDLLKIRVEDTIPIAQYDVDQRLLSEYLY